MAQTYHNYANVYDFRSYLGGTDHVTDWDTDEAPILRVLEAAAQRIDQYAGRSFGARTATRSYDLGSGALRDDSLAGVSSSISYPDYWSSKLSGAGIVPLDDWLISATTVTAYHDTGRSANTVLTSGIGNDYLLEPYNSTPKTILKLEEDTTDSLYGGQQTLTILGTWGWQDDKASISTIDAIGSTSTTSVSVASGSTTYVGDTLVVDSEQLYVTAVSGNNLTVIRGVNGTTAATHSGGVAYYRWKYPSDVAQASLDVARTYWRSRDVGIAATLGAGEMQLTNPQFEERQILKRLNHYLNRRETAIYV
jgi:hypothetical protein